MEFHGPIVRPYTDADSLFIEVTTGCTHNSCTFCNFYKDTPFRVAPIEQVEKDLQEASREVPFATRIWASGGNPFCLLRSIFQRPASPPTRASMTSSIRALRISGKSESMALTMSSSALNPAMTMC